MTDDITNESGPLHVSGKIETNTPGTCKVDKNYIITTTIFTVLAYIMIVAVPYAYDYLNEQQFSHAEKESKLIVQELT